MATAVAGEVIVPSASILNFVAGLFAGAGINLLTSAVGGTPDEVVKLTVLSVPWILASIGQAYGANLVESADRSSSMLVTANHTVAEAGEIRTGSFNAIRTRFRISLLLVAVSVAAAVAAIVLTSSESHPPSDAPKTEIVQPSTVG